MKFLEKLGLKNKSASMARERLKMVISHQRMDNRDMVVSFVPELEKMQEEIVQVIGKYIKINSSQVEIKLNQTSDNETLEVNIPIFRKF